LILKIPFYLLANQNKLDFTVFSALGSYLIEITFLTLFSYHLKNHKLLTFVIKKNNG